MQVGPMLLGAGAGWLLAGLFDKSPIVRGIVAATGAYAANAIASALPAPSPPPSAQPSASPVPSTAPAGSSDTLSSANLASATDTTDAGGGGSSF